MTDLSLGKVPANFEYFLLGIRIDTVWSSFLAPCSTGKMR